MSDLPAPLEQEMSTDTIEAGVNAEKDAPQPSKDESRNGGAENNRKDEVDDAKTAEEVQGDALKALLAKLMESGLTEEQRLILSGENGTGKSCIVGGLMREPEIIDVSLTDDDDIQQNASAEARSHKRRLSPISRDRQHSQSKRPCRTIKGMKIPLTSGGGAILLCRRGLNSTELEELYQSVSEFIADDFMQEINSHTSIGTIQYRADDSTEILIAQRGTDIQPPLIQATQLDSANALTEMCNDILKRVAGGADPLLLSVEVMQAGQASVRNHPFNANTDNIASRRNVLVLTSANMKLSFLSEESSRKRWQEVSFNSCDVAVLNSECLAQAKIGYNMIQTEASGRDTVVLKLFFSPRNQRRR